MYQIRYRLEGSYEISCCCTASSLTLLTVCGGKTFFFSVWWEGVGLDESAQKSLMLNWDSQD
ncbi:MAG: hypothetical protein WD059_07695 [Balneolaceae bacterium]